MSKTIAELLKEINDLRLANKNKWYYYLNPVKGIRLKGYNTWIQVVKLYKNEDDYFTDTPYIHDSSAMDMSVALYKGYLFHLITDHLQKRNINA